MTGDCMTTSGSGFSFCQGSHTQTGSEIGPTDGLRFAYADPPYMGMGHKYPEKSEVNHPLLIDWLCRDFDAWALSLHTPSLRVILPMCPPETRVCAWVKPFCSFKPNNMLAYAWEPVLVWHSQRSPKRFGTTERDWISANITLQRGFCGAKPNRFAYWMFEALGMRVGDQFTDVFPGSGAVTKAWDSWRQDNARLLDLESA